MKQCHLQNLQIGNFQVNPPMIQLLKKSSYSEVEEVEE
jgi:hypothetical protein